MKRSELIERISETGKISHKTAEAVVHVMFDSIAGALVRGERVEIRGFGSFVARKYESRVGCNPRTGEAVEVPAKRRPYFRAGQELSKRVDYKRDDNGEPVSRAE